MSFQSIPGQQQVKHMLQGGLRNSKVSHAYIFSGPKGTGKQRMAFTFAKAIFCKEQIDDACGHCLECRKAEHSNHPDLHFIKPDGATIRIEQIRDLQKEFSYRATSSQTKIYIIEQADRMTVQAANSLLKFLEEPQSMVVAILITENGQALLPTIQSRAQWIHFSPLIREEMASVLTSEGFSAVLVHPAVHLTAGLEAARELIQINWFAEIRTVMIQLAKECTTRIASALIIAQNKVVKTELNDHMDTLLDLFILWCKDMIHIQCNRQQHIVFIDQLEWLKKHAFSQSISYWINGMEQAAEAKKRLRFHVNPQLALEQFMIAIEGG